MDYKKLFKKYLLKEIEYETGIVYDNTTNQVSTIIIEAMDIPNKENREWAIEEALQNLAEKVFRKIYKTIDTYFHIDKCNLKIHDTEIICVTLIKHT